MFLSPPLPLSKNKSINKTAYNNADSWPSTSRNPLLWIENTIFDPEVVESLYLKPWDRKADYIFLGKNCV